MSIIIPIQDTGQRDIDCHIDFNTSPWPIVDFRRDGHSIQRYSADILLYSWPNRDYSLDSRGLLLIGNDPDSALSHNTMALVRGRIIKAIADQLENQLIKGK